MYYTGAYKVICSTFDNKMQIRFWKQDSVTASANNSITLVVWLVSSECAFELAWSCWLFVCLFFCLEVKQRIKALVGEKRLAPEVQLILVVSLKEHVL